MRTRMLGFWQVGYYRPLMRRLARLLTLALLLGCDPGLEPELPVDPPAPEPLVAVVIDDGSGYALDVLRQELGGEVADLCRASRLILGNNPPRWTIVYRCERR